MKLGKFSGKDLYRDKPKDDQFKVVYAIVSDKEGELDLPFFSKVTLKNACRKLEAMGFQVAIAKIDVSSDMKMVTKHRDPSKRKAA